jgi:hypothetical protein
VIATENISEETQNPLFHAFTRAHFDRAKRYWLAYFVLENGIKTYIFERFLLEDGEPLTWPSMDDLPEDIHPDSILPKDFSGRVPRRGAYQLTPAGVPLPSYDAESDGAAAKAIGELGKSNERMGISIAAAMGGGNNRGGGGNTQGGGIRRMNIRVKNAKNSRQVDLHVPVNTEVKLGDLLRDGKVNRGGVNRWDPETITKLKSKEMELFVGIWDSPNQLPTMNKEDYFFVYDREDINTTTTEDLFHTVPKNASGNIQEAFDPLNLCLYVVENNIQDDEDVFEF